MTIVPHHQLQPETLSKLIEEFVTRDGAVHGHGDSSMDDRVAAVVKQLNAREVVIVFDEESESCTIVKADQAPRE